MSTENEDEEMDREMERWLKTPGGQAAMREVMAKAVAGEYGEVDPALLEMAQDGLRKHELTETALEVRTRLQEISQKLQQPWEGSRWQHLHDLNVGMKDIMDLILELSEPQRTMLMKLALPLQEMLEKMEKEH